MSAAGGTRFVVLKFGGTSVSTAERWATIERVTRERLAEGVRPVLVCSALCGITDKLEDLLGEAARGKLGDGLEEIAQAHRALAQDLGVDFDAVAGEEFDGLKRILTGSSLLAEVSTRARARVLGHGELLSTRLGTAFLTQQGLSARWVDARQCLTTVGEPHTDDARQILSANCLDVRDEALREKLSEDGMEVVVTQGFIAQDKSGKTVVLGRGGSDSSASYFAAALGAERCEIWTDVPGLFTADPRHVPTARLLRSLTYAEAQEIASTGAKVLHPRCLPPLRRNGIPLHVRSTKHADAPGTEISANPPDQGARVKAISWRSGITLISMESVGMWQQVGFLADVFACFQRQGLSVDIVSTSETNVTVSLDPGANALLAERIRALLAELEPYCKPTVIGPCASVSLVGNKIRAIMHKLGPALEVFEEQRIHLISQAASDLNLTFVVDEDQAGRLVRQLHSMLFKHTDSNPTLGPTWDQLQSKTPDMFKSVTPWWQVRRDELLAIALHESPAFVYDRTTITRAAAALSQLGNVERVLYSMKANSHPDVLRTMVESGLGLECVSLGELERVQELFPRLDPSRVLFTPNFAPRREYERAFDAGVPVTLDNLHPLLEWPELFRNRELFVRLDPGGGRGHHAHVRTAGAFSKFGVVESDLGELAALAREGDCRIVGLHSHRGSGILDSEMWPETALFLASAAERYFPDVRVLDLGGGLGIPESSSQAPLPLDDLDASLARVREAHPRFELWLEPGRYLIAQAGVLLTRVTQTKRKGALHYIGVDTGMNSLIRPALYGSFHEIVNLSRLDDDATLTASIGGPICETGDMLGHARRIAPAQEGDVLLIANTGAYGHAMSSHYNLRKPARELFIEEP